MDVHKRRLDNLRALIREWGGPTSLSKRLGYSNPTYLVQLAGPNPSRPLWERSARAIEKKLGLPDLWFDKNEDVQPSALDAKLLRQVVDVVLQHKLPSDKAADIIALLYEDAKKNNAISLDLAARLVALVR